MITIVRKVGLGSDVMVETFFDKLTLQLSLEELKNAEGKIHVGSTAWSWSWGQWRSFECYSTSQAATDALRLIKISTRDTLQEVIDGL